VVGSVKGLYRGKLSTKVERTPLCRLPCVAAKELSLYGRAVGLKPPDFSGHVAKDDDIEYLRSKGLPDLPYVEPHLYNLMRHRNADCDPDVLARALADLKESYAPSMFDNVRPLTDYEALRGLPGSFFRPMNLSTGAGHPFYGPKSNIVTFDDANKQVWVHPQVRAIKEQMEDLIRRGIVPLSWSSSVPKDEALDALKVDRCDARMINVVSLSYIWLYRKYCYPLDCIDFLDPESTETRVGINCANPSQVRRFVESFEGFDVFSDEDAAAYDVRQNTQYSESVSVLHQWQATEAGYSEDDRAMVWGVSRMSWNFVKEIKGELYFFRYSNPSGDPSTTVRNCKINRIADRYGFFHALGRDKWFTTYQSTFKLATFGDDRLKGAKRSAIPLLASMQAAVADSGLVFTSGSDKTKLVDFKDNLEGLSFLKRTIRREGDIWLMALSEKSILGMFTTRYRGSLSATDHYAVLISTAMVEASFHSEAVFEEWLALARASADYLATINICVTKSAFWRLLSFAEYRSLYLKSSLHYWTPTVEAATSGFYAIDQSFVEKLNILYMFA
jgi:hypothetical protein